jgi:hypothetical protein
MKHERKAFFLRNWRGLQILYIKRTKEGVQQGSWSSRNKKREEENSSD